MLIVDCGSPRLSKIVDQVERLGQKTRIVTLDDLTEEHFNNVNGAIISGSPTMLSSQPEYVERYSFLKNVEVALLGICYGHQLLGTVYGSEIRQGEYIKGEKLVHFYGRELFRGIKSPAYFMEDHEEYITLPKDFVRIAESWDTAVEAMVHYDKPVFSVQFHPESSGETGDKLVRNFLSFC